MTVFRSAKPLRRLLFWTWPSDSMGLCRSVSLGSVLPCLQVFPKVRAHEKTRQRRVFCERLRPNHFSLISLYSTCLRALGSNFMIDIFSGMVFLFLLVV